MNNSNRNRAHPVQKFSRQRNDERKVKLRQACLERMRSKRLETVSRARRQTSGSDECLQAQYTHLLDTKGLMNEFAREEGLTDADMFELMADMEEDLRKEEEIFLHELEIIAQQQLHDERQILDFEESQSARDDDVICPVCQSRTLFQTKSNIIMCPTRNCLRLDVASEGLTLLNLRKLLSKAYDEHGNTCNDSLSFHVVAEFGITTLRAVCQTCRCNVIVI